MTDRERHEIHFALDRILAMWAARDTPTRYPVVRSPHNYATIDRGATRGHR